jgi:hypothetical protein
MHKLTGWVISSLAVTTFAAAAQAGATPPQAAATEARAAISAQPDIKVLQSKPGVGTSTTAAKVSRLAAAKPPPIPAADKKALFQSFRAQAHVKEGPSVPGPLATLTVANMAVPNQVYLLAENASYVDQFGITFAGCPGDWDTGCTDTHLHMGFYPHGQSKLFVIDCEFDRDFSSSISFTESPVGAKSLAAQDESIRTMRSHLIIPYLSGDGMTETSAADFDISAPEGVTWYQCELTQLSN